MRFVIPGVELGDVVQLVDEFLCLHVIWNVDVGLTAPSHCSKRRCWARCTFVSFEMETSGLLAFVLFIVRVLGFVLHTSALSSLWVIDTFASSNTSVLGPPNFLREVESVLVPSKSGGWW